MNEPLTFADRFFRGQARYMERPVLKHVASQPILRRLFAITAPLGQKLPNGMTPIQDRAGHLTFRPKGVDREAPVILYIHGGGFTIGAPRTHAALVGHLAQASGLRAIAASYPLAPEHPCPAARTSLLETYRALIEAGTPPVAICGDSAGGCLALLLAMAARDEGLPAPKALCLIAPVADLAGDISERFAAAKDEILIPPEWARRIEIDYLRGADATSPDISPLFGDLSGLPPTLIQVGSGEALRQDAERLADAMDDVRLDVWEGLQHVWQLHAGRSPAANRAVAALGAFIKDHA